MPLGSCVETASCNFTGDPFGVALMPYTWTLGAFSPLALWGIIFFLMWLRTQNIMLIGIIGVALNALLNTFYAPARQIGWFLLALAVGVLLYQLWTNRIHHGSSV